MGMRLGEKQELFSRLLVYLLTYAHSQGYDIRMGETWRSKAAADDNARRGIGIKNSLHRKKLAVDLNLFKDGKYLTSIEGYLPLGEYWLSLHPLCRWGGDFKDPYHFSITHRGVR